MGIEFELITVNFYDAKGIVIFERWLSNKPKYAINNAGPYHFMKSKIRPYIAQNLLLYAPPFWNNIR